MLKAIYLHYNIPSYIVYSMTHMQYGNYMGTPKIRLIFDAIAILDSSLFHPI